MLMIWIVNAVIPAKKISVIAQNAYKAAHLSLSVESTSFEERIAIAEELCSRLFDLQMEAANKEEEKVSAKLLTAGKDTNGTGSDDGEGEKSQAGEAET